MRLLDDLGDIYALGIAADQATVRQAGDAIWRCPSGWSPSPRSASPCWTPTCATSPSTRRWSGSTASRPRPPRPRPSGRSCRCPTSTPSSRRCARCWPPARPLVDQYIVGRTPADPDNDHAWSVSFYRLEDPGGRVLGLASLGRRRHRAPPGGRRGRPGPAAPGPDRRRLRPRRHHPGPGADRPGAGRASPSPSSPTSPPSTSSTRVPAGRPPTAHEGPALFRALAVAAAYPNEATARRRPARRHRRVRPRPAGHPVRPHRAAPSSSPHVGADDLPRIARDADAAALLAPRPASTPTSPCR